MDVMKAIEKRRSVRAYQSKFVPEDKLKKILQAARLAPSARNSQPHKFIIVKDPQLIKKLAKEATEHSFIGEAPVIIVGVALDPNYIMSSDVPAHPVDIAIAIDHMTLIAVEEGLGTCWIGGFNQDKIKQILNIPEKCKAVILLSLGYPADSPAEKQRKSQKELICQDSLTD